MEVETGRIVGGKYELERLLGKGSMGEVWLARHTSLEGSYAVKLVDVDAVPDAAGRFQMEAHIAAKLSKKTRHIVSVTDYGEEGHIAYLVMQLLEGQALDARIQEAGPLSMIEVSTIISQIARALVHAQAEGFVHRDLKPANVFLTNDEDGRLVVKVLDFGIARALTRVRTRSPFETAKDTLVGTPSYMSPEQALGLDTIDHRCDLWALGVLIYEALTRQLPFEGEGIHDVLISIGIGRQTPIRERRPDLPEAIDAFYAKAFAEAIEDRFASASDLAAAFAEVAGVDPSYRSSVASMPDAAIQVAIQGVDAATSQEIASPVPMRTLSRRGLWLVLVLVVTFVASSAAAVRLARRSPRVVRAIEQPAAAPRHAPAEATTSIPSSEPSVEPASSPASAASIDAPPAEPTPPPSHRGGAPAGVKPRAASPASSAGAAPSSRPTDRSEVF